MPRWRDNTPIAEALRDAADQLAAVTDTARLDAELLLAHALRIPRSDMLLRSRDMPGEAQLDLFEGLVARRMEHEPVAYIIGAQEFFGREFMVAPGALIPRADSETVLLAALEAAKPDARVLDCGTGPGTLLLSFLAERPAATGIGIDASAQAAGMAAANTGKLGLTGRAQFLRRDWSEEGWTDQLGRFDLILANPPYVEDDAALAPDVARWEPAEALFAGPEGLDDYRVLIPQLDDLLGEAGIVVLEIGAAQENAVSAIAENAGFSVTCHKDLGERPRALVLRLGLGK